MCAGGGGNGGNRGLDDVQADGAQGHPAVEGISIVVLRILP